jgi:co-chaperonin GroES (HSP10)
MINTTGINPKGWRILVKPQEVLEKSAGGILLSTEKGREREQMANTTGIVLAMGEECFAKMDSRWCDVGDKIVFAKYAGLLYKGRDGVQVRIINDTDVTGTLDADVDLVDPNLV